MGRVVSGMMESGLEALDYLEEHEVEMVITDIEMPYMNGLELSKRISKQYPNIKIIYLTAHDKFDYAQTGIEVGIAQYILRPVNQKELERVIAKVVDLVHDEWEREELFQGYKDEFEEHIDVFRNELLILLVQKNVQSLNIKKKNIFMASIWRHMKHIEFTVCSRKPMSCRKKRSMEYL